MPDVIADFGGEVYGEHLPMEAPVEGRIVSNREEVVLATAEQEIRIDHDDVFDLVEKQPMIDVTFVDPVLTIGYVEDGKRRTAFVGAPAEAISRFRYVLTKAIVVEQEVRAVHPERVGGRVADTDPSRARLSITREAVRLRCGSETVELRLSNVTEFERTTRTFPAVEERWPAVRIRHVTDGTSKTTLIGCADERVMTILGRYLRVEYENLRNELAGLDLSAREVEALVTLYSGGDTASLTDALGVSVEMARTVLDRLDGKGLVSREEGDVALTDLGRVVMTERLASVNA